MRKEGTEAQPANHRALIGKHWRQASGQAYAPAKIRADPAAFNWAQVSGTPTGRLLLRPVASSSDRPPPPRTGRLLRRAAWFDQPPPPTGCFIPAAVSSERSEPLLQNSPRIHQDSPDSWTRDTDMNETSWHYLAWLSSLRDLDSSIAFYH